MRIASCCMNSVIGRIDDNLKAMESVVRGMTDVDLFLFPELCLTGYAMPESRFHGMNDDSYAVMDLIDLTSENGTILCFGYVDIEGHIRQVVAENGYLLGGYNKTHLGVRESEVMTPGDSLDPIHTSKADIGIQICWESHFPEISTTYALKGADILLMPHASGLGGERRRSTWNRIIPARAYDNTVFAVACNAMGDNGVGTVFGGGSCIVDPRGRIIGEDYSGGMTICDVDDSEMMRIRNHEGESMSNLYFLDKRHPELYYR